MCVVRALIGCHVWHTALVAGLGGMSLREETGGEAVPSVELQLWEAVRKPQLLRPPLPIDLPRW